MFSSVLGFQIAIFLSILFTRVVARSKLELLCIGWTIFTFVMVFASPLILLQLVVIWGSYAALSGGTQGSHTAGSTAPPKSPPAKPTPSPQPKPKAITAPSGRAHSGLPAIDAAATGAARLRAKSEALLDAVEVRTAVQQGVQAAINSTYTEAAALKAALKQAREQVRLDELYDTPEKRARFDSEVARLRSKVGWTDRDPAMRSPSAPADFRFPERHSDPRVASGIEDGILEAKCRHEVFLDDICAQLGTSAALQKHFWGSLDALDEPLIRQSFESYVAKQRNGGKAPAPVPAQPSKVPAIETMDLAPAEPFFPKQAFRKAMVAARTAATAAANANVSPSKNPEQREAGEHAISPPDTTPGIRQQAERLGIKRLYHFTRAENLPSIMRHGLKPVSALQSERLPFRWNDEHRIDGHEDAISLSVSHPNEKLFFRWRMSNREQRWVVLALDVPILWELDAAFCPHNAADRRIIGQDRQSLASPAAFAAMFAETGGAPARADQELGRYDPTDVQAEVLVFADIPATRIHGAVFSDEASLAKWRPWLGECVGMVHAERTGLFGLRSVARKSGKD